MKRQMIKLRYLWSTTPIKSNAFTTVDILGYLKVHHMWETFCSFAENGTIDPKYGMMIIKMALHRKRFPIPTIKPKIK